MPSLYIHFPWCIKKCSYCDFNSYAWKQNPFIEETYINALISDFISDFPLLQNRQIQSIYLGGGTPSLISIKELERLLRTIQTICSFQNNIEITIEANPATFNLTKAQEWSNLGINRVSLGIQSFQDQKLKTLGRIHDSNKSLIAIAYLKTAGFTNYNIDLMYGLPQQSTADALFDLTTAISCAPTHISWYQLTIEPNTPFGQNPSLTLPDEDKIWEIQNIGIAELANNGFKQYEVSAYSKSNYCCQHNLNYWQFGDYLGIGAGAHSKITNLNNHEVIRYSKICDPKLYIESKERNAEKSIIPKDNLLTEFMLNALRLYEPIQFSLLTEQTQISFSDVEQIFKIAKARGLLDYNLQNFAATPLGKQFLDDLLILF